MRTRWSKCTIAIIMTVVVRSAAVFAQQPSEIRSKPAVAPMRVAEIPGEMTERERILIDRIEKLERRLADLEAKGESKYVNNVQPAPIGAALGQQKDVPNAPANPSASNNQQISREDQG